MQIRVLASALILSVFMAGCDNITTTTDIQDVVELKWRHDGNGIFGLIQKLTLSQYQTIPSANYNPCAFNTDGSLNKTISCDQSASTDISYSIFSTPDDSKIAAQLGGDLYTIDPSSGSFAKRYLQFHLLTMSPDLHYAVGSISPSNRLIKTILVIDISGSTSREVTRFDISNMQQQPGAWLSNGRFGITLRDSAGSNIAIYDTTGVLRSTIPGASTAFHNSIFFPTTNDLYFRNQAGKTNDYSVDKINLTSMQRANVVPLDVESFDVSTDQGLMVYNRYALNSDSTKTLTMYAKNLLNGNEQKLTNDVLSLVALSPVSDRVAYVHARNGNYNEVFTMTVTRP